MSKVLRISATIAVPDAAFEQAEVLARLKPVLVDIESRLCEIGGDAVSFSYDVVSKRPRKVNEVAVEPAIGAPAHANSTHLEPQAIHHIDDAALKHRAA